MKIVTGLYLSTYATVACACFPLMPKHLKPEFIVNCKINSGPDTQSIDLSAGFDSGGSESS